MAAASISVILPTRDRAALLAGTLASLACQTTCGLFAFDVVVVDNASSDATGVVLAEAADGFPVPLTCRPEPRRGDAFARNAGIAVARGEWLAFIDDDEVAEPTWLAELYRAAAGDPRRLVGGAVHAEVLGVESWHLSRLCRESVLRERGAANRGDGPRPMRARELPGCDNLLLARPLVDLIGGFDVSMRLASDHDFAWRARQSGAVPWFAPAAVVRHRVQAHRLQRGSCRLAELRGGAYQALLDHRYRGALPLLAGWAARAIRAATVDAPAWLACRLAASETGTLGRCCRLWRFPGYSRRAAAALAPALLPQRRFFAGLDRPDDEGSLESSR